MQSDAIPVEITLRDATIHGDLEKPPGAGSVVVFAHGSGSGRFSSRNRYVAGRLRLGGHATLLIDLLTVVEERVDIITREYRFNIPLLARRVDGVKDWVQEYEETEGLRIGYFGSSTGAAAALIAAAESPEGVGAVVSRGGRVDLADEYLPRVQAPTLLIVGELDYSVIDLNRKSMTLITAPKRLDILPEASHLFEEPGALEEVARLASGWFSRHLQES